MDLREAVIKDFPDRIFIRWIYWIRTHYSCIRVDHDPNWIKDVGPSLKQFYKDMIELRSDQKRVQEKIRNRELIKHNKKTAGNTLFVDCLI